MQSKQVDVVEWRSRNKTIKFLPVAHVGQPQFYQALIDTLRTLKQQGYIVYYEGVLMERFSDSVSSQLLAPLRQRHLVPAGEALNEDSIAADVYRRKLRRVMGVAIDSGGYLQVFQSRGIFRGMVNQPGYKAMGIGRDDVRADISINELIDVYERSFGAIGLEQIDFAIPLQILSSYPRSRWLPRDQATAVIVHYRDEHLASALHASAHQKIVVVYGMAHLKGTWEVLRQLDDSWVKAD